MEKIATIYPKDALLNNDTVDVINLAEAHTLDELFRERVRRMPNQNAYSQYDQENNAWKSIQVCLFVQ